MYHIKINSNLMVWETEKAYLIRYPGTIWKFWVSKKLVRPYRKHYEMLVFDSMIINMISDRGSKKKVDQYEFLNHFGFDMDFDVEEDLKDCD